MVKTVKNCDPWYQANLASSTSQGQLASSQQQDSTSDARVGTAAVALASSVAKYWVLTGLFPGPLPQVSVYHTQQQNSTGSPRSVEVQIQNKEVVATSTASHEMALAAGGANHQSDNAHRHHQNAAINNLATSNNNNNNHTSNIVHASLQQSPQVCRTYFSCTSPFNDYFKYSPVSAVPALHPVVLLRFPSLV